MTLHFKNMAACLFQFIYGRLEILNAGVGFIDVFEQQATLYADKLNSQSKYKEWLKSVKVGILAMCLQGKKLLPAITYLMLSGRIISYLFFVFGTALDVFTKTFLFLLI